MKLLRGWREIPIAGIPFMSSIEYKTGSWRAKKPIINDKKCIKCGLCWVYCPDFAIKWDGRETPKVDYDFCKGCGICCEECPVKAIEMVRDEG
ncbi:pyruvate ferredoxin oxidoreductase [Candidatus Geothermarchaeota archaeon]|nr:MAG: pyruvate ferredoxin oxidoreductase [Candidatus Geothermarchaeota archaeon]